MEEAREGKAVELGRWLTEGVPRGKEAQEAEGQQEENSRRQVCCASLAAAAAVAAVASARALALGTVLWASLHPPAPQGSTRALTPARRDARTRLLGLLRTGSRIHSGEAPEPMWNSSSTAAGSLLITGYIHRQEPPGAAAWANPRTDRC